MLLSLLQLTQKKLTGGSDSNNWQLRYQRRLLENYG